MVEQCGGTVEHSWWNIHGGTVWWNSGTVWWNSGTVMMEQCGTLVVEQCNETVEQ